MRLALCLSYNPVDRGGQSCPTAHCALQRKIFVEWEGGTVVVIASENGAPLSTAWLHMSKRLRTAAERDVIEIASFKFELAQLQLSALSQNLPPSLLRRESSRSLGHYLDLVSGGKVLKGAANHRVV